MAKKIEGLKTKIAERLKEAFYNDCQSAYEERKALYYDASKLPRGQLGLMYKEASYVVSQRLKWRFIYKLSEMFNL